VIPSSPTQSASHLAPARPCFTSLLVAALFLSAAGAPIRAATAGGSANVVLGLLLPPEEAEAASLRAGVQLAVEQANQAPSPKVSLVIRGRVGQWGADAVEAARMVLDDGAQGLIATPDGAATHLALQVAGRTAVPVISLCPDASVSQTGVPWMVRIVPASVDEARLLLTKLEAAPATPPRWTALVPDGRAGRERRRELSQAALSAGRKFTCIREVNATLTNFDSVAAETLKGAPDGVLIWLDPVPAGKFVRHLRNAGFAGKLAGPSRCQSPAFLAAAGAASEGFFAPGMLRDEKSEARWHSFRTAFRQRFGTEADLTAAESYDAAALLTHLIANHDPQALPRAFPLTFSLPGVTGDLSFDAQGNRKVTLELLVVRQGRFGGAERELGR